MLEGRLVRLRAIEPSDRERVDRWVNDLDVTHFLSMRYPLAWGESAWLSSNATNDFTSGVRLAIETTDGEHIGAINLHQVDAASRHAGMGIIIGEREYWSKGYGADAVNTLLRFAFEEMNLNRVWLTVVAEHQGAIRCYEKCGFREEARLRQDIFKGGRFHDYVLMGVLRSEFALRAERSV